MAVLIEEAMDGWVEEEKECVQQTRTGQSFTRAKRERTLMRQLKGKKSGDRVGNGGEQNFN